MTNDDKLAVIMAGMFALTVVLGLSAKRKGKTTP